MNVDFVTCDDEIPVRGVRLEREMYLEWPLPESGMPRLRVFDTNEVEGAVVRPS